MKVLVAGATGVLGRRLCRQLVGRGHSVLGLVRSAEGEEVVRSLGAESRIGDLFDADSLARISQGIDVVIHAATAIPKKSRPRRSDWETNDRIRTAGTRALTKAAGEAGVRIFLFQSIAWVAQPEDGSKFDEDSTVNANPILESAVGGEKIAMEAGKSYGFNVSVLRCGIFYSADSFHTRLFGEYLTKGRMALPNGGMAKWSLLHVEDAANAFLTAAERGRNGLWHVIDDQPVAVGEFLSYLANRLGARSPRHLPRWLMRILAGKYTTDFLSISMETSNGRFKKDFAWTPRFPTYKEGLDEVISDWRSEGYLQSGE